MGVDRGTKPGCASLVVYAERKLTMEIQSKDVAALAGVSEVAVLKMRRNGTGPAYIKRGGRYAYELANVIRWLIRREVASEVKARTSTLAVVQNGGRVTP